ncbi:hypothetical protein V8Z74_14720 [Comamonas sp. w2-DMI]|uniref:hypothetical protein n=1 Tax=Comamonas sp. w2-DMI TaxID=3126391 RepID=UPI0032E4F357
MTNLLKLTSLPAFKCKDPIQLNLSYTQAILIGVALGLGGLALRVLALTGAFCGA